MHMQILYRNLNKQYMRQCHVLIQRQEIYNQVDRTAFIPNEEIRQEFISATKSRKWNELLEFETWSDDLLNATLDMDEETVSEGIEKIHTEYASMIQYNDENSLSSVLLLHILLPCGITLNRFGRCRPAGVLQILYFFRRWTI